MNTKEKIEELTIKATNGDADAQNELGCAYHSGDGVDKNYTQAYRWFKKSAMQGNKYAMYNLGLAYEYGRGVKIDYKQAHLWYGKLSSSGYLQGIKKEIALWDKYDYHLDRSILKYPSFINNPFRVLGVYTNATARDIAANKSRMDAFLRLGKLVEFPTDTITKNLYSPLYELEGGDNINDDAKQNINNVYKTIRANEKKLGELKKEPLYSTFNQLDFEEAKKHNELIEKEKRLEDENLSLKSLYEFKSKQLFTIRRTKEIVESALVSINQPIDRIKNAFFWFIKVSSSDEKGLNCLITKGLEDAYGYFDMNHDYSSLINLGICSFMQDDLDEYIKYMTTVIHNENHRLNFVRAVCGNTFQISEEELAHLFIDTLVTEMPNEDWLILFRESGVSGNDDEYISEILAKEPIKILNDFISKSASINRDNGEERYRQAVKLMTAAKEQLPILEDLIGTEALRYQQIADKTAREILNCSIDYFKTCGDTIYDCTKQCLELREYTSSIALGATLKDRIKECLDHIKAKYDNMPPANAYKLFSQIREIIADFSKKPDLIKHSHELLAKTFPLLCEIKEVLGSDNKSYLAIATEVAGNALVNIVSEINIAFEAVDKAYKSKSSSVYSNHIDFNNLLSVLKSALKSGWQEFLNMDQMDFESDFNTERYQPNRDTIKHHLSSFQITTTFMYKNLPYMTETEFFKTATSIYSLKNYLQLYPNGKYVNQAKTKIDNLVKADDDFWDSCLLKRDFEGYLKKYAYGQHSKDAKAEIEKLKTQEEEEYWNACAKNGDYKLYLQKYEKGRHAKEANAFIEKREKYKNWFIWGSVIVAILAVIAAIWGAQGFVVLFGIIAFLGFGGAVGRGDAECGMRLACLGIAGVSALIAYLIANIFNV